MKVCFKHNSYFIVYAWHNGPLLEEQLLLWKKENYIIELEM